MSKSTAKPMSELVSLWADFYSATPKAIGREPVTPKAQTKEHDMGRYAANSGGGSDFELVPPGTQIGRCIRLIDLGTQPAFKPEDKPKNKVRVFWEIPGEEIERGGEKQPMLAIKTYTNSLHEKATLRADLESWRGRAFTVEELLGFDLQTILNAPALLTIVHETRDGSTYANVKSVSKLMRGMECPPAVNKPFAFWLDSFDQAVFDTLSDNTQQKIKASPEYKELFAAHKAPARQPVAAGAGGDDFVDDIPF